VRDDACTRGGGIARGIQLPGFMSDMFGTAVRSGGGQAAQPIVQPRPLEASQERDSAPKGTKRPKGPDNVDPPSRAPRPGDVLAALARVPLPTPRPGDGATDAQEAEPGEIVAMIDGDGNTVAELAAAFDIEVMASRPSILLGATYARFRIGSGQTVEAVLARMALDPRVVEGDANHVFRLNQAFPSASYAFHAISLERNGATGEGVRVGVIDTAADREHPTLRGVIVETFNALAGVPLEDRGHGTSITGLIAGGGSMAGVAPGAKVYHARAFENGKSNADAILAALDWVAGKDVRIVNMSFTGPQNRLMKIACAKARERGAILVAAAGNQGPGAPPAYPAAFASVMAVTAVDQRERLMQQANRGEYVYVAAPGVDLVAPISGGADIVTGTSFAAAIVSGAIANLLSASPEASGSTVEQAIAATARDLGQAGRDQDFGYGLIDYEAAMTEINRP
jgi:subtilisin family serine protease